MVIVESLLIAKYAALGTGAVLVGSAIALPAAGFTTGGVAAGSMAAGIQAGIGNVLSGSAFATAQSMGASGVGALVAKGIGFTAFGAILWKVLKMKNILKDK